MLANNFELATSFFRMFPIVDQLMQERATTLTGLSSHLFKTKWMSTEAMEMWSNN
jgi:hypothetical protein